MTAYARAHVMKNSVFEVDEVDYANQVTNVTLTPEQNVQTLATLVPDGVITDTDNPVWTLTLAGVQDFGASSLGAALRTAASAGTDLDVEYQPKAGTGQDKAVFVIRPVHIPFGGSQGEFRTFDVQIPVVGQPTFSQSS